MDEFLLPCNENLESFIKSIQDSNEVLLETLGLRCSTKEDERKLIINAEPSAVSTGRDLLEILSAMVTHQSFSQRNARRQAAQHDGEYLRTKIEFGNGHTMTIHCESTKNQPGNAVVHLYGSYTNQHSVVNLYSFSKYFDRFLRDPMELPDNLATCSAKSWKLSVLLLFEIARRIPKEDVYHEIPVAYGIAMALNMSSKMKPADLFGLFVGKFHSRHSAFRKIYHKKERQALMNWTQQASTTSHTPNNLSSVSARASQLTYGGVQQFEPSMIGRSRELTYSGEHHQLQGLQYTPQRHVTSVSMSPDYNISTRLSGGGQAISRWKIEENVCTNHISMTENA